MKHILKILLVLVMLANACQTTTETQEEPEQSAMQMKLLIQCVSGFFIEGLVLNNS